MAFRVTNSQFTNTFINQVNQTKTDLEKTRNRLTSGLDIANPSDDPARAGTVVGLQNTIQRIERHKERISYATNFLSVQETAMSTANEVMIRLKELATQGANGTIAPDVRQQIADEVFQLRDQLASLANTKEQGVYIYGGTDDDDPPFVYEANYFEDGTATGDGSPAGSPERGHWLFSVNNVITADTELGHDQTRLVNISDTEKVRVNTSAKVFEDAITAATLLGRSLEGYQTGLVDRDADGEVDDLQSVVDAGNTNRQLALSDPLAVNYDSELAVQLGQISQAMAALDEARSSDIEIELSSLGARLARVEQTESILESIGINTEEARAAIQDTDVVEAASSFANLQTNLEALLATGARISNLSLLDFI
jgi:flagellar hook-associated protein 3 FlgL